MDYFLLYRENSDDQWGPDIKNGPEKNEKGDYDGPVGMEPEGVIESNWDQVNLLASIPNHGFTVKS